MELDPMLDVGTYRDADCAHDPPYERSSEWKEYFTKPRGKSPRWVFFRRQERDPGPSILSIVHDVLEFGPQEPPSTFDFDYLVHCVREASAGQENSAWEAQIIGASSAEIATSFRELAAEWKSESRFISSVTKMAMLPSYQRIIGLGQAAIPLILRELEQEPNHWFWALGAITRQTPYRREDAGDLAKMREAWLAWGKQRGHL